MNQEPYKRMLREEFGAFKVEIDHLHHRLNFIAGTCEALVLCINALTEERKLLEKRRRRSDRRFAANRGKP